MNSRSSTRRWLMTALLGAVGLSGCVVVSAVDTAASVTVDAAGMAVDAATTTAKVTGHVVGSAARAATGTSDSSTPAPANP